MNIFNKLKANESERKYSMSIRPEVMKSLKIIQNKFSEIKKFYRKKTKIMRTINQRDNKPK